MDIPRIIELQWLPLDKPLWQITLKRVPWMNGHGWFHCNASVAFKDQDSLRQNWFYDWTDLHAMMIITNALITEWTTNAYNVHWDGFHD